MESRGTGADEPTCPRGRGGYAVAEVKLAECMSRVEGATALGLRRVCTRYIPDWVQDLESYGIFGSDLDEESDDEAADSATAEIPVPAPAAAGGQMLPTSSCDRPRLVSAAGPQRKLAIFSGDLMDRPRLVSVKVEPGTASGGQPMGSIVLATPSSHARGSPPKRRRVDKDDVDVCQCSGQCGSSARDARRNHNVRRRLEAPCPFAPELGQRYCRQCQCEVHECAKPRYRARWCKSRKPQFQDDGDHKRYSNPYAAKVAFPDEWPPELRLVAKFKYVLPRIIPADFTVLLEWCPDQTSPSFLVAAFRPAEYLGDPS